MWRRPLPRQPCQLSTSRLIRWVHPERSLPIRCSMRSGTSAIPAALRVGLSPASLPLKCGKPGHNRPNVSGSRKCRSAARLIDGPPQPCWRSKRRCRCGTLYAHCRIPQPNTPLAPTHALPLSASGQHQPLLCSTARPFRHGNIQPMPQHDGVTRRISSLSMGKVFVRVNTRFCIGRCRSLRYLLAPAPAHNRPHYADSIHRFFKIDA